ncbi:MAG: LEA type 2 family protein [Treponema sp.]|nr:LEA type 2 family protein [Treponema sp.]
MRKFCLFLSVLPLLVACKSQQIQPDYKPAAVLELEQVEAYSINQFNLYYNLIITNPLPIEAIIEIDNWDCIVNGMYLDCENAALTLEGDEALGIKLKVEPSSTVEKILTMNLDLKNQGQVLINNEGDEYITKMSVNIIFHYEQGRTYDYEAISDSSFPHIKEPQFTITSIAVLQAELVNTRFRVRIRIDNPNIFPVALSSFGYILYGDGRFWANGRENDLLDIPAQSSAETNLYFMMNFIDMKRQLLDDIIAMRDVSYRFLGNVEVGTNIALLPRFKMDFERSGNSPVYK